MQLIVASWIILEIFSVDWITFYLVLFFSFEFQMLKWWPQCRNFISGKTCGFTCLW